MENDHKKRTIHDINEEMMMDLMVDGVRKEGLQLPAEAMKTDNSSDEISKEKPMVKDKSKSKKAIEIDYESFFFKRTETNARDGKTVYIRPDFHEKLSRIVQVIGQDKITIYGYLDNMLDYHFQEFGEQITKSFNDKYKPIL